jgi:N-acetylglucosamine-6-sulfatase
VKGAIMTVKKLWRLSWMCGFVLATACDSALASDQTSSSQQEHVSLQRRPNIVFILTDDMALHDVEVMPKLKKLLIDEGTTFTNYFVTNSLCCPSRASILRGQYVHNHHVDSNIDSTGEGFQRFQRLGHEKSTIATWLKAAGYTTGLMGKYLNGYADKNDPTHVPEGWDDWNSPIDNNAYKHFQYSLNENGKIVAYGDSSKDYLTDVIARKAAAFIHKTAAKKEPFFLYLAPYAPHAPATPAPRHQALFPEAKAPRTASFNEKDVSTKPEYVRAQPMLSKKRIKTVDQLYRRRIQSLQAVDDLLEQLIATLKETGELGNTFIVFTSDNGFHLGQHRLFRGKRTAYEEDIHVPLIIRGPGVSARHSVSYLALETDLAPTFAEWASVTPPSFVDGRSIVALFKPQLPPLERWRQAVLIEHVPDSELTALEKTLYKGKQMPRLTAYKALRSNNYLYVQYSSGERELYDLRNDPDQLHNVAAKLNSKDIEKLSLRLRQFDSCNGAGCRTAEDTKLEQLSLGL